MDCIDTWLGPDVADRGRKNNAMKIQLVVKSLGKNIDEQRVMMKIIEEMMADLC